MFSQRKTNNYDFTCMWNLKKKKKKTYKQTHRFKEQIGGYQRGKRLKVGKNGEGGQLHGDGQKLDLL